MPENDIHQTQAAPPKSSDTIADAFKKYIPAACGIVVFGLFTYWYGSHDSAKKMEFQVEMNRIAIEKIAAENKETAAALNQLTIGVAKLSESQARMATDQRDMQDQQRRNTESLINRK